MQGGKPDNEIIRIPGGMPRIIDDETWRRVQVRLSDNTRNSSNTAKRVYILSGKIVCGDCGAVFVGKTSKSGRNKEPYSYYICGNRDRKRLCDMPRVGADLIEQGVIDLVSKYLHFGSREAAAVLSMISDQRGEEPPELTDKKAALRKTQQQLTSIVSAIRDGAYHPMLRDEMIRLSGIEQELQREIDAYAETSLPSIEDVSAFLSRAQNLKKLSRDEQKRIIADLVSQIVVRRSGPHSVEFQVFSAPMVEAGSA